MEVRQSNPPGKLGDDLWIGQLKLMTECEFQEAVDASLENEIKRHLEAIRHILHCAATANRMNYPLVKYVDYDSYFSDGVGSNDR
jgi:hypothetical protein